MAGEKDAASIFPWSEEGRPDQLLIPERACARAPGDSPVLDRGEEE